ncbi:MAG: hypothetical protein H6573_35185 [Lewinellaceae bacterium]|nr:hypothetical protein [Lewinellaceae bacterium]
MLTLGLWFDVNVALPKFIGLGRGVSQGFGMVGGWNPKKMNCLLSEKREVGFIY